MSSSTSNEKIQPELMLLFLVMVVMTGLYASTQVVEPLVALTMGRATDSLLNVASGLCLLAAITAMIGAWTFPRHRLAWLWAMVALYAATFLLGLPFLVTYFGGTS